MDGYVLQKMGRADAARQWYAAALKLQPHDELASKLLALMG
jgi:Flp pilus assembly protein TadD